VVRLSTAAQGYCSTRAPASRAATTRSSGPLASSPVTPTSADTGSPTRGGDPRARGPRASGRVALGRPTPPKTEVAARPAETRAPARYCVTGAFPRRRTPPVATVRGQHSLVLRAGSRSLRQRHRRSSSSSDASVPEGPDGTPAPGRIRSRASADRARSGLSQCRQSDRGHSGGLGTNAIVRETRCPREAGVDSFVEQVRGQRESRCRSLPQHPRACRTGILYRERGSFKRFGDTGVAPGG